MKCNMWFPFFSCKLHAIVLLERARICPFMLTILNSLYRYERFFAMFVSIWRNGSKNDLWTVTILLILILLSTCTCTFRNFQKPVSTKYALNNFNSWILDIIFWDSHVHLFFTVCWEKLCFPLILVFEYFLFFCLYGVFLPTREFFTHSERHYCRWRAANFDLKYWPKNTRHW